MSGTWQHGLMGCFDNFGLCLITWIVPCYTFGKNAEAVGSNCLAYGLLFNIPIVNMVLAIGLRGKIRNEKSIEGGMANDILSWICCPFCSLMQEAQEVAGIAPQAMAIERV